jgi:hypothetical protein
MSGGVACMRDAERAAGRPGRRMRMRMSMRLGPVAKRTLSATAARRPSSVHVAVCDSHAYTWRCG